MKENNITRFLAQKYGQPFMAREPIALNDGYLLVGMFGQGDEYLICRSDVLDPPYVSLGQLLKFDPYVDFPLEPFQEIQSQYQNVKDDSTMHHDAEPEFEPEQVDDQITQRLLEQIQPVIRGWIQLLQAEATKASSYQDFKAQLPRMYAELQPEKATQLLEQHLLLARLVGADPEFSPRFDAEASDSLAIRVDAPKPEFLRLRPAQAIAYFRQKIAIPTETWTQMSAEAHDFAYTIARLTQIELLKDAQWLIDNALAEGVGYEKWTRQFNRLIRRKGWVPPSKSEKDLRHKLWITYHTPISRAIAAQRYKESMDPGVQEKRPYLVWRHRNSPQPREHHLALHNKAIRSDHPFWLVAFPPCDFGCRCSAFSVSMQDISRFGFEILENPPDPKTIAGKGFQRAPGTAPVEERQEIIAGVLDKLSPELRHAVESDLMA